MFQASVFVLVIHLFLSLTFVSQDLQKAVDNETALRQAALAYRMAHTCQELAIEVQMDKEKMQSVVEHNQGLKRQLTFMEDQMEGLKSQIRNMHLQLADLQKQNAELTMENKQLLGLKGTVDEPMAKRFKTDSWNASNNNAAMHLRDALYELVLKYGQGVEIVLVAETKMANFLQSFVELNVDVDRPDKAIWRVIDHNKAAMDELKRRETIRWNALLAKSCSIAMMEPFFLVELDSKNSGRGMSLSLPLIIKHYTPYVRHLFYNLREEAISKASGAAGKA